MLESKKAELRREIARRERELEKLETLPDFSAMADGTVAALAVRLGSSNPYTYVGLKTGNRWFLTGKTGPNGVTSDKLAEWLSTGGRELMAFLELAEIETAVEAVPVAVEVVDLGELLGSVLSQAERNDLTSLNQQIGRAIRQGNGRASGWGDEDDYGSRYGG